MYTRELTSGPAGDLALCGVEGAWLAGESGRGRLAGGGPLLTERPSPEARPPATEAAPLAAAAEDTAVFFGTESEEV